MSTKTRPRLDDTFTTLRDVLRRHEKRMKVLVDKPGDYQLGSQQLTDRIGRPLWAAAVQVKKNYVSYHLMPVYAFPDMLTAVSPSLKKRMQGKGCFNFTAIDAAHVEELSALTNAGFARIKTIKLPWK